MHSLLLLLPSPPLSPCCWCETKDDGADTKDLPFLSASALSLDALIFSFESMPVSNMLANMRRPPSPSDPVTCPVDATQSSRSWNVILRQSHPVARPSPNSQLHFQIVKLTLFQFPAITSSLHLLPQCIARHSPPSLPPLPPRINLEILRFNPLWIVQRHFWWTCWGGGGGGGCCPVPGGSCGVWWWQHGDWMAFAVAQSLLVANVPVTCIH